MKRRDLLALPFYGSLLPAAQTASTVQRIYLIHLSHMDVGFTDHPEVTREMQKCYLDQALDACAAERDFRWTVESLVAFEDWWKTAKPERRRQMLETVDRGQIGVCALPCNNTPFLDSRQWDQMVRWLPDDLWTRVKPAVAVQNDVNGFPRAGVMRLLNRGVNRLFMGLNGDSGGPPVERPTAFWWRMPDGRRILVYLGDSYPTGYSYFHERDWRRGPVPRVAQAEFRLPRAGDFFLDDPQSLRQAHQILERRLARLRYGWPSLVLPFSNQWRMDNDPPFPHLARFVRAWNREGLKPELRLLTAAQALEQFERESGPQLPELSGEWPDWWANGSASAPREVAASRAAKAHLRCVESPVFAPLPPEEAARVELLRKDLCLFDEHTWGAALSVAQPDSPDTLGQFNEKARLAWRSAALAEWMAAQRARAKVGSAAAGLHLVNTAPLPYTGWVSVAAPAIRGSSDGIDHYEPGMEPWGIIRTPADLSPENDAAVFPDTAPRQVAKFWVADVPPGTVQPLRAVGPVASRARVELDARGWPNHATWPGLAGSLFSEGLGRIVSIRPTGFAPRRRLAEMSSGKPGPTETLLDEPGSATLRETGHTLVYTQTFAHSSLRRGRRTLELWKSAPRATLTVDIYRRSSNDPECLYVQFPFPLEGLLPRLSSGGLEFTPYQDQLPGSCRDYFAIDGWAQYSKPGAGHWLWVSRDAPLITFGEPAIWARRKDAAPAHRLLANVFNNFWYTNFVGDEHGAMRFRFDLLWSERPFDAARTADSLAMEPIVVQQ